MIKKILFLLFFSIIAQAQQVKLESIERLIINDGKKSIITTSQSYDEKTKKLEVLYSEKGLSSSLYKTITQFDEQGKKELQREEFTYNPSTKKWEKDNRTLTAYKNNKEIITTYNAEANKWTEYKKYENENTDNSNTYIIYSFKNKKWLPVSKTHILLNKNKENSLIEEYLWNKNEQNWELESKLEYSYNQEGKLEKIISYKKENNWIAKEKLEYYTDNNGNKISVKLFFENGKWIEQDKTVETFDKINNKKFIISQELNRETKQLENYYHSVEVYLKDEIIKQEIVYLWDKNIKNWKKSSEQNYFYNEQNQLIRKQDFLGDNKGVQFTYNFDKNGNNIEILIENFNFQSKLWEATERIEYLYDSSITKEEVADVGNIDDEAVNSVNPLLEKKHYIYKNGKWIMKEHFKYFYSKK